MVIITYVDRYIINNIRYDIGWSECGADSFANDAWQLRLDEALIKSSNVRLQLVTKVAFAINFISRMINLLRSFFFNFFNTYSFFGNN